MEYALEKILVSAPLHNQIFMKLYICQPVQQDNSPATSTPDNVELSGLQIYKVDVVSVQPSAMITDTILLFLFDWVQGCGYCIFLCWFTSLTILVWYSFHINRYFLIWFIYFRTVYIFSNSFYKFNFNFFSLISIPSWGAYEPCSIQYLFPICI